MFVVRCLHIRKHSAPGITHSIIFPSPSPAPLTGLIPAGIPESDVWGGGRLLKITSFLCFHRFQQIRRTKLSKCLVGIVAGRGRAQSFATSPSVASMPSAVICWVTPLVSLRSVENMHVLCSFSSGKKWWVHFISFDCINKRDHDFTLNRAYHLYEAWERLGGGGVVWTYLFLSSVHF